MTAPITPPRDAAEAIRVVREIADQYAKSSYSEDPDWVIARNALRLVADLAEQAAAKDGLIRAALTYYEISDDIIESVFARAKAQMEGPAYPRSPWDDCPSHEWKDVEGMSERDVICKRCGAPGERQDEDCVYWPAT